MFLLTGGNGQLGTELRHLLDEKNLPYVSTDAKDLDITDAEGDDVTNDIFVGAKAELEKHIWMIAAELGQAPGL